jgi:hypothetical protein
MMSFKRLGFSYIFKIFYILINYLYKTLRKILMSELAVTHIGGEIDTAWNYRTNF